MDSGDIWLDYLRFIRSTPPEELDSTLTGPKKKGAAQNAARINALRALFSKAVEIPLMKNSEIWREYDKFEQETCKATVSHWPILSGIPQV